MRLFLDTANIDQIRQAVKLGVISGVTTNPSLLSKEKQSDYKSAILEICSIVNGPVSVEVLSQDTQAMIEEAKDLSSWSPYIAIKIPCSTSGFEACSVLSKEGVKVNLTLCFSTNQALLAALAGATYVSPFVGRLDDIGQDGMILIKEIMDIYDIYDFPTQVISASIRHPMHCVASAQAGAHIATVPYNILMQMVQHPLTTIGIQRFMDDWQKVSGKA